jgi:hypothetical protein
MEEETLGFEYGCLRLGLGIRPRHACRRSKKDTDVGLALGLAVGSSLSDF